MRLRSRWSRFFLPALSCAALLGAGKAAWGQIDLSAWPQVKMGVTLLDERGDPLQQARAEGLVVKEAGQILNPVGLSAATDPQSVCILIDSSGSAYERLPGVLATAERLLSGLPVEDEVCVADFSHETYVDGKLTTDRETASKSLKYIKASGGTALYDAVIAMAELMRKSAKNDSRVLVLLTDGDDNDSKAQLGDMRKALMVAGSPVVEVFRVPASARSGGGQRYAEEGPTLDAFRSSGGLVYYPRKMSDMEESADHLLDALKWRYLLTYTAANPVSDGTARRAEVTWDKMHQKQKWMVRAPEGYYAPAR